MLSYHHEVIDVVEYEGSACAVRFLGLEEMDRLLTPMPPRVEMVGCVVAVIEAVTVALHRCECLVTPAKRAKINVPAHPQA